MARKRRSQYRRQNQLTDVSTGDMIVGGLVLSALVGVGFLIASANKAATATAATGMPPGWTEGQLLGVQPAPAPAPSPVSATPTPLPPGITLPPPGVVTPGPMTPGSPPPPTPAPGMMTPLSATMAPMPFS